jgi:hypothetical protein
MRALYYTGTVYLRLTIVNTTVLSTLDSVRFAHSRLLEAVHRLVYSEDDVGLTGGVGLDGGEKIKA